jgi:hypothetical protein
MIVNCKNCNKEFEKVYSEIKKSKTGNHFCSRSCAATFNNKIKPKKTLTNTCKICNTSILASRKYCDQCSDNKLYCKATLETAKTDRTRKRILIEQLGHKCYICNNTEWNGKPIPLELEHIDGDSDNNKESNLQLICPNCHAQTPTYKGANKGNSKRQIKRRKRYKNGQTY